MELKDKILVEKSKKGDFIAFEELVRRYEKKIYNLAYRIMGNREDAKDVLQETFLQVFRKISSFEGKADFSTWLYRIAVNACLMRKRKGKNVKIDSLDVPILTEEEDEIKREVSYDWSDNPLATLENTELKRTLHTAIDSLPVDYRTIFILRDIDGLSNEEAARIAKISIPAVKSRLHRARLFLRDKLSGYFKEHGGQAS